MSTNEPMTQERLDAIQERLETATRGPWAHDSFGNVDPVGARPHADGARIADNLAYGDADLIAHAPDDLADLLAEVARLQLFESIVSWRHGDTTTRTCAPIIRLTTPEVFAALHRLHLPVHPSYAMTMGGHYDRTWLRVHHLLSTRTQQSGIHGDRTETWENTYYPDIIRAAHQNRAHLWKDTHVVQGR